MPLTGPEKDELLAIAREAIVAHLKGTASPVEKVRTSENLLKDSGAFVSIHRGGRLRGCIGTFASPNPLYKTVIDMAVAAASQDPRFPPVDESELKYIKIEISVLSPLKEIKDPSEIEIGKHGIYIVKGLDRGVLLPQVAIEHAFNREEFLEQTCLKAGLPEGSWRKGAAIFIFDAEILKEP